MTLRNVGLLFSAFLLYRILAYPCLWAWHYRKDLARLQALFGMQLPESGRVIFGYRLQRWPIFPPRLVALHLGEDASTVHFRSGKILTLTGLSTRRWTIRPAPGGVNIGSTRHIRYTYPRKRRRRKVVFSIHSASARAMPEWRYAPKVMMYYEGRFGYGIEVRPPS